MSRRLFKTMILSNAKNGEHYFPMKTFVSIFRTTYFFYLSSHRDRFPSFQARQFLILFDNTDLSAQKVQRLILYLCCQIPQRNHFFVPSICRVKKLKKENFSPNGKKIEFFSSKFAQRLSSLVGETLGTTPNFGQRKNLFYL